MLVVVDDRSGDELGAWPGDGDGDSAADASGIGGSSEDTGSGEGQWGRGRRRTGPVTGVLAPLVAALADLVGPEGLDDQSLSEAVVDFQRVRSLLDSAASAFVGRWDARRLWADDGSRSAGARLARDAGTRPGPAHSVVRTARGVGSMDAVKAAWAAGRIGSDHVRRLVDACTPERTEAFARVETDLVASAENLEWVGFERVVAMFEMAADDERLDPNDPVDVARHEQAERAKRRCRLVPVGDGWQLSAHFDRVSGAIVHTALERIVQELFDTEWAQAAAAMDDPTVPAPILRTASQRHLDALVELARRAGASRVDDQAPKPLVSVVVSAGELFGPIRETFNGLVLSRLEVARLLTETDFESIVFDDTTAQPVTVSTRARFFTGALRRAVEVRDRVCQHPTCRVEAEHCQIDHIIEATAGGPTCVTNGRLLCGVHNRQRPGRRPRDNTRTSHQDPDGDPDQPHTA